MKYVFSAVIILILIYIILWRKAQKKANLTYKKELQEEKEKKQRQFQKEMDQLNRK